MTKFFPGAKLRLKLIITTKPLRRRSSQYKRLQRVRAAEIRVEMLVGKWTVEGVLKSQESIAQRFVRVREGGCVSIRRVHRIAVNQGGTAGLILL